MAFVKLSRRNNWFSVKIPKKMMNWVTQRDVKVTKCCHRNQAKVERKKNNILIFLECKLSIKVRLFFIDFVIYLYIYIYF